MKSGIKAILEAMNVAYEETEKCSFLRLNLLSLAFTLAAMAIGAFMIITVGVIPTVLSFLDLSGLTESLSSSSASRWCWSWSVP